MPSLPLAPSPDDRGASRRASDLERALRRVSPSWQQGLLEFPPESGEAPVPQGDVPSPPGGNRQAAEDQPQNLERRPFPDEAGQHAEPALGRGPGDHSGETGGLSGSGVPSERRQVGSRRENHS